MRIKSKIWKTGNSKVLTIPSKLDIQVGEKYWITLERVEEDEKQA